MRRRCMVIGTALALLIPGVWLMGAAPAKSENKGGIVIAYVDLDRVAKDSEMVMKRVKNIESQLTTKRESLKTKVAEHRKLQKQLIEQESVLTVAQVEQAKKKMKTLKDEIDYLSYQMNKVVDDTSRDVIEPVLDQVLESVERVAKASKVDLVLRGDLVLFASDRVDLTAWVVQDLDRSLKATESRSSPAPKASGTGAKKRSNK